MEREVWALTSSARILGKRLPAEERSRSAGREMDGSDREVDREERKRLTDGDGVLNAEQLAGDGVLRGEVRSRRPQDDPVVQRDGVLFYVKVGSVCGSSISTTRGREGKRRRTVLEESYEILPRRLLRSRPSIQLNKRHCHRKRRQSTKPANAYVVCIVGLEERLEEKDEPLRSLGVPLLRDLESSEETDRLLCAERAGRSGTAEGDVELERAELGGGDEFEDGDLRFDNDEASLLDEVGGTKGLLELA